MRHILIASSLLLTGCVANHQPPPAPPIVAATQVEEPVPAPVTAPVEVKLIDESPEVQQAMERYVKTGKAPLIDKTKAGFVVFPYGEGNTQPTAYCTPLTHCDIELEPGENILSVIAGDQERWKFSPHEHGPSDRRVKHIMVKPTDYTSNMKTDITIGTDRRNYHVWLVSRLQGRTVNVKFYFPNDLLKTFNMGQEAKPIVAPPVDMAKVLASRSRYSVEGDQELHPALIGDNGTHTFFVMPDSLHILEAPVLFALSPSGQRTQINYRLVDGTYKADKLFDRAVLAWGVGRDERIVTITRK